MSASGGAGYLPSFQQVIRAGANSQEVGVSPRPVPNIPGSAVNDTSMSLRSAVLQKQAQKLTTISEPRGKSKKFKKKEAASGFTSNDSSTAFSNESSPTSLSKGRKRTPMTMPRTKVNANTPLEQKIALNKLKQRLDFELKGFSSTEQADEAPDVSQAQQGLSAVASSMAGNSMPACDVSVSSIASISDMASEASEFVDESKIKKRLDQVREYLRQATSMYVNLSMSENGTESTSAPSRTEQLSKLAKLIQQLRVQEQGYIDLLQRTQMIDEANSEQQEQDSLAEQEAAVQVLEEAKMAEEAKLMLDVKQQKLQMIESQQAELEKLREQHTLLKKIVEQEKQLKDLKDRQSTLLQMQSETEGLLGEAQHSINEGPSAIMAELQQNKQNNLESIVVNVSAENEDLLLADADAAQQRLIDSQEKAGKQKELEAAAQTRRELEGKLASLQEKKQQMDNLLNTLKSLKETHGNEHVNAMQSALTEASSAKDESMIATDLISSFVSSSQEAASIAASEAGVEDKLKKLNEVRDRLQMLKGIVADYNVSDRVEQAPIPEPAGAGANNLADTASGVGGARKKTGQQSARITSGSLKNLQHELDNMLSLANKPHATYEHTHQQNSSNKDLSNLQNLQTELENLLDNRQRPAQQKKKLDLTKRNPKTSKASGGRVMAPKRTNQEEEDRAASEELQAKLQELQQARNRLTSVEHCLISGDTTETDQLSQTMTEDDQTSTMTSQAQTEDETSESESENSQNSSILQWQDDPEFQAKVRKLHMAKEKLAQLQELVKTVQVGGGATLPVDDLVDLSLSLDTASQTTSAYGESEEEEEDEDEEEEENGSSSADNEQTSDKEDDEDTTVTDSESQSVIESQNHSEQNPFGIREGELSDNERVYQELLRKQRQELNSLLKEREKLLEAQQKLSEIAANNQSMSQETQTETRVMPLTKAVVSEQDKKQPLKKILLSKMSTNSIEPQYGSESDFRNARGNRRIEFDESTGYSDSNAVAPMRPNNMVVSELRRQREMFEEKKKQKFVEKQQRKKEKKQQEEDSDECATYSVNSGPISDIDEGVGVSMFSADVTTAATWGGSTEASSDQSDDSAVEPGDEEEEDDDQMVDDSTDGRNKKRQPKERQRRNISWFNGEDVALQDENDDEDENAENAHGNLRAAKKRKVEERSRSHVSFMEQTPPKGSPSWARQGNLTPAYKLMQDREANRRGIESQMESPPIFNDAQPVNQELHGQLATMCNALLKNEQTLLSMLQNKSADKDCNASSAKSGSSMANLKAYRNIRQFFERDTEVDPMEQTLRGLRMCSERVEQHQRDMAYLQRQFCDLDVTGREPMFTNMASGLMAESPWPMPDRSIQPFCNPLETKSACKKRKSDAESPRSMSSETKSKPAAKQTQTESSLFGDNPFVVRQQGYSLFGGQQTNFSLQSSHAANVEEQDDCSKSPKSPGTIGAEYERQRKYLQYTHDASLSDIFPTSANKVSEYNPDPTGNFPKTFTQISVTTSHSRGEGTSTETTKGNEKTIWPSFFKQVEDAGNKNASETASQADGNADNKESNDNHTDNHPESSGSNYSLFEALRDSIYSEVATLISMNEARPHYLIELFRELQLLTSDYLRQRALYSLQDLVTRFLTDDNAQHQATPTKKAFHHQKLTAPPNSAVTQTQPGSGASSESSMPHQMTYQHWIEPDSEQTPSESVIEMTDDENETNALQALARQIQNNEFYDYAELAETMSDETVSSSAREDVPFAKEDLGNTAINLDEALEKMRLYEQNMLQAKIAFEQITDDVKKSTPQAAFEEAQRKQRIAYEAIRQKHLDSISNSSAGDGGSQTSEASDMPQPSIDTQKLDKQIKSVMMDLIPFLNDHMESVCTLEFLNQIKQVIVNLAKQKEPESDKEEFGKFFHKQLESILQDSLLKFSGRHFKECGEDILIDVSEILFNELAFFRLMQDLDSDRFSEMQAGQQRAGQNSSASGGGGQFTRAQDAGTAAAAASATAEGMLQDYPNGLLVHKMASSVIETSESDADTETSQDTTETQEESEEEVSQSFEMPVAANIELSVSESRVMNSRGGSGEEEEEDQSIENSQQVTFQNSIDSSVRHPQDQGSSPSAAAVSQPVGRPLAENEEVIDQADQPEDERDNMIAGNGQVGMVAAAEAAEAMNAAASPEADAGAAVAEADGHAVNVEDELPENEHTEAERDVGQIEVAGAAQQQQQGAAAVVAGAQQSPAGERGEEEESEQPAKPEDFTECEQHMVANVENAANIALANINESVQNELADNPNELPEPNNSNLV